MQFLDAVFSFVGRAIIALLSLIALIALATVVVVWFEKESSCKDIALDPQMLVASTSVPHMDELATMPNYVHGEQASSLTFPEWYIVYSAREYGHFLGPQSSPTKFPFGLATAEYWCSYHVFTKYAETHYPPDTGSTVVLMTVGASFSAENMIQSIYEQSFGRVSAWDGTDTPEDKIQREEAQKYAKFLDTKPWYEYPFFTSISRVWRETPLFGPHMLRKWERKSALTAGYGVKGLYGIIIKMVTRTAFAPDDPTIMLLVRGPLTANLISDPNVKVVKDFGDGTLVVEVPRYQQFSQTMLEFAHENISILDIAGGKTIIISALAPTVWDYNLPGAQFFTQPLTVDSDHKRVVAVVPTSQLLDALRKMNVEGVILEHIYDY